MNTYGIAAGPKAMPSAGAAGIAAGQAAGKDAAGGTFAGTLVYVMGGANSANSTTAAGGGIPASLLGLTALLAGGTTDETDVTLEGLLKLIDSLVEQLGNLEDSGQLPEGLQNQLAELLALVQKLIEPAGTAQTSQSGPQPSLETALLQEALAPKSGQTLVTELQQALKQLADKIAQGEVSKGQMSSVSESIAQSVAALQQFTSPKAKVPTLGMDTTKQAEGGKEANIALRAPHSNAVAAQETEVQPEVRVQSRQAPMPGQVPIASAIKSSESESTATSALNLAASLESAETAPASSPTPVWTLLKGNGQNLPLSGSANTNAQLPQAVPVQQFAQEMGKYLVKQFVLSQGNGVSEARISLHPEHLGQLDIRIVIQNGILTAKFVAETSTAREMLETQMAQLRSALQGQGLQVDKVEVVQQQPSYNQTSFMGNHQGQQGTGHDGGGAKKGNSAGYEDSASFEAELDRSEFLRDIGYGSSLNVTA